MDRFVTQPTSLTNHMRLWIEITIGAAIIVALVGQDIELIYVMSFCAIATIIGVFSYIRNKVKGNPKQHPEENAPYLTFDKDALIYKNASAVEWHVPLSELSGITKKHAVKKHWNFQPEGVAVSTLSGDSYTMPGRTLSEEQVQTISHRITGIIKTKPIANLQL